MLVAGGTAGWSAGTWFAEVVGLDGASAQIIAGLIGAGVLGAALGMLWDLIIKMLVQDDAADMLQILNRAFASLATDYMLNEKEAEAARAQIVITGSTVRDMYASGDRNGFATALIRPVIIKAVKQRTSPLLII